MIINTKIVNLSIRKHLPQGRAGYNFLLSKIETICILSVA